MCGCLLLALVGGAAGRYYIDLTGGVTPMQFIRGEWFVGAAMLTGRVWILIYWASEDTWVSTGVAFVVGFGFRTLALFRGWEEPLAKKPNGVVLHHDGRPLLGRKLAGKSRRELHDLGVLVENEADKDT